MQQTNLAYDRDEEYWSKYLKGRPPSIPGLFDRICKYHAERGGTFGVVHEVAAGVGFHSELLSQRFEHVIVSDIVENNVEIAKQRLGTDGTFSYYTMKIEDANVIPDGSVDVVFAATCMHFVEFQPAFEAIAKQLKPGGTFVAFMNTVATLDNPAAQDVMRRIWFEGMYVLLRHASDRAGRLKTLGRAATGYDVMPVPEKFFENVVRMSLNTKEWPEVIPPELGAEYGGKSAVGPNEKLTYEDEPGYCFTVDCTGLREQFDSFPFTALEPETFAGMWKEMEEILPNGKTVNGVWPAKIIMATRK